MTHKPKAPLSNPDLPQSTVSGLSVELNRIPEDVRHIHLMGVCGTGMASLAGMLKEMGFGVTGSDQNVYPPMSRFLEDLGIPVLEGYREGNLSPRPDLVIVGNVITKDNPEALELSRLRLPYLSFPQAICKFALKDKRSLVVAGTHGKTTVSSAVAWILERAGRDPSFMIGGIPLNFNKNFKIGMGSHFVLEGDEYDTAFFDKGPKFLHYRPWVAILTSIEFDHADIYRDLDHVIESFRRLIALMPAHGLLISNGDDLIARRETLAAPCPVMTYGFTEDCLWRAMDIEVGEEWTRMRILKEGREYAMLTTGLYGRHNIANLLSAVAVADFLGISRKEVSTALREFSGVKRRQEIMGEKGGVLVLDDFAHHPTAVKATVEAVREKYRNRRLIAVFEPRSNSSRRRVFQVRYTSAFQGADLIMIPEPPLMEKIPLPDRFSSERLVADLAAKGFRAHYFPGTDQLLEGILSVSRPGDVVLIMSNGAFDDLHHRLLARL